MRLEYCIECDQETGNAGIGDDSLYLEDGRGPYCDCCYYKNRVEEVETEIERLRRVEQAAREYHDYEAGSLQSRYDPEQAYKLRMRLKAALEGK